VILLTGATGFVGRNLAANLSAHHRVLAPSRRELDLLDPVATADYLGRHKPDVVIHGATTPGHRNAPKAPDLVERNLRMFHHLARCRGRYGRLIHLGSGAVYDVATMPPKISEEPFDAHVPADPHGFAKYVVARHLECIPDAVELRLFGVFGPHEDYAIRFISNALCKALLGLPITIRQDRRFDYLYVDDLGPVVEHFIGAAPRHRFYNVTPDAAVALTDIADLAREAAGADVPVVVAEPGMGPEYSGDNRRLRAELPGLRFTPLRDAVAALCDWYRARRDAIDPALLAMDR
jgi:nucleoside-diphosphate-sugar epimerase